MSLKPNELLQQQINLLEDANSALTSHLDELKGETAEWIDELQGEDARQAARLDALEQRLADNETNLSDAWRTIHIARKERDTLERRLVAVEELHGTLDSLLVVPGEASEWVQQDGHLVYDLDITKGGQA